MEEKSKVDKWVFQAKNHKYVAPIIFGAIVFGAVFAFGKNIADAFWGNQKLEKQVEALQDTLNNIKQSLKAHNLTVVNGKVVTTENNYYGHVGDSYSETTNYNQLTPNKPNSQQSSSEAIADKTHNVEIESPTNPTIFFNDGAYKAVFRLRTRTMNEAHNVKGEFAAVMRSKGMLYNCNNYPQLNSSVITHYTTDFRYEFTFPNKVDTYYIFFKIMLTNILGEVQPPFQGLYRRCDKTGQNMIRLSTGTREYKEVIEQIFPASFP